MKKNKSSMDLDKLGHSFCSLIKYFAAFKCPLRASNMQWEGYHHCLELLGHNLVMQLNTELCPCGHIQKHYVEV